MEEGRAWHANEEKMNKAPSTTLQALGWSDFFQTALADRPVALNRSVGRIGIEFNNFYLVHTVQGEMLAEASGKLLFHAKDQSALPKVGDWVVITMVPGEQKCIIHALLPRRTTLSRKIAGQRVEEQIIAANLDTVFIVQGLDDNYNLRRMERYLPMIYEGGMTAAIILNKCDLDGEANFHQKEVETIAGRVPVFLTSCLTEQGLDELKAFIQPGSSYALVGSSGVGKSSLINGLCGRDLQTTLEVRAADSKGRHATTRREMIALPGGGILIDTPGMRELQIWDVDEGIKETFGDIEALASECYFSDCRHISETKCAVKAAVEAGALSAKRYENYLKMLKEQHYLESRLNDHAVLAEKQRKKRLEKGYKRSAKLIRDKKHTREAE